MLSRLIFGLVLGVAITLSQPAFGQFGPRSPGSLGGIDYLALNRQPVLYVLLPSVQQELQISNAQGKQLSDITTQLNQQIDEVIKQLDHLLANDAGTKAQAGESKPEAQLKAAYDKANKQLKATLSGAQEKRQQGIMLQLEGPTAFEKANVRGALKLTVGQKRAIDDALRRYQDERLKIVLGPGGDSAQGRQAMRQLEQATMNNLIAVLDQDQKMQWHAMIGKPFRP